MKLFLKAEVYYGILDVKQIYFDDNHISFPWRYNILTVIADILTVIPYILTVIADILTVIADILSVIADTHHLHAQ